MNALVYYGPRDIRYEEVPTPQPGPGQVLVRVKAVSICGSDLAGYKAVSAMRKPPLIMGHEFSGQVAALGEGVHGIQPGDRVGVVTNLYCGTCKNCRDGLSNVCDYRYIIGTTMKAGSYNGAMAEYVVAPAEKLMLLPDSVSYEECALVEPLSISLRAVKHAGRLDGKIAAVFGVGPIGLMGVMCLKIFGASRIIAIDVMENRLKMARECGATDTINSNDDVESIIRTMTDDTGVDVVFDAAGVPQTVNRAIEIARNGGTILMVGMASPTFEIEYKHAVVKELRLQSSYMYTTEMHEGLQLIIDGKLDVKKMITGRYPMSEGPRIFEELASGKAQDVKVILTND
ncbi:MAG: galactitol-1-phosphate 5-dehydrogenase [Spirochaetales bacterium]|nr:galactitol-1-phosphate 5-dehydrogenase [Spirochaetales bacterium]